MEMPDYGTDEEHEWPRAWYGVKGYFRWLESKAYKMHVRVLLSRYRAYTTCPECKGRRLQPDALLFKLNGLTLSDFYLLPVRDALRFVDDLHSRHGYPSAPGHAQNISRQLAETSSRRVGDSAPYPTALASNTLALNDALPDRTNGTKRVTPTERPSVSSNDPLRLAMQEVRARLHYLDEVGLGYLTLDRPTRSLSGGETERVNLTTCLGTRLVNTLYVLDEPSVGLHARDTDRLVRILRELRDLGNTVVVVEHEPAIMRAADHIVDLGPGHGERGGQVVYAGDFSGVLKDAHSLTAKYLSGRQQIPPRPSRPVNSCTPKLRIENAMAHNLKDVTVNIPLNRFVCLTGVSGSGKSTLARDVLVPLLQEKLGPVAALPTAVEQEEPDKEGETDVAVPPFATLTGFESIGDVMLIDQSALGRTPRSNPAVYVGAFEPIRELFALTETARQRGLNASAFSFNSGQGQCEKCRGAGFEKIEMQFLSDVFVTCPECNGRRYREHILEVKLQPEAMAATSDQPNNRRRSRKNLTMDSARTGSPGLNLPAWSIADLLDATIDEVVTFLGALPESRHRTNALISMKLLQDVGLGYLHAGQPINTLSGGESQRLKLVSHLAESARGEQSAKPKLFIFDEPTTGLHFDDVRVLVDVFQRLVDDGHSLLVIEHNLELIRCADWVIDLGPEAGDRGGEVVAEGTPSTVARNRRSLTGLALAKLAPSPATREAVTAD